MHTLIKYIIVIFLFTVGSLSADQCWLLDSAQSQRAKEIIGKLKVGDIIIQYCEPCQTKPEKIIIYTTENGLINKVSLDYAYIFISLDQGSGVRTFSNVAKLIGCPTTGDSPSIKMDPSTLNESSMAPKPKLESEQNKPSTTNYDDMEDDFEDMDEW